MRLPDDAHTSRPWRIHEIAADFGVEDVWAPAIRGGREDFPRFVEMFASQDLAHSSSHAVRALVAIRRKLGELLGWDARSSGAGAPVGSLRERLPAELRARRSGARLGSLPFKPLYLLDDEFAAEIANRTMHGVLHLGWVPDGAGNFRAQMTVLVKPNGLPGKAYMAAIRPFRHLIVYPAMMRESEGRWRVLQQASPPGEA